MWQKIISLSFASLFLTCCDHNPPDLAAAPLNSDATLCSMIKQKILEKNTVFDDPVTMKRKNPADQAREIKQYESYSCPEILDAAPMPDQIPNP